LDEAFFQALKLSNLKFLYISHFQINDLNAFYNTLSYNRNLETLELRDICQWSKGLSKAINTCKQLTTFIYSDYLQGKWQKKPMEVANLISKFISKNSTIITLVIAFSCDVKESKIIISSLAKNRTMKNFSFCAPNSLFYLIPVLESQTNTTLELFSSPALYSNFEVESFFQFLKNTKSNSLLSISPTSLNNSSKCNNYYSTRKQQLKSIEKRLRNNLHRKVFIYIKSLQVILPSDVIYQITFICFEIFRREKLSFGDILAM
jgi:hypothetical protein